MKTVFHSRNDTERARDGRDHATPGPLRAGSAGRPAPPVARGGLIRFRPCVAGALAGSSALPGRRRSPGAEAHSMAPIPHVSARSGLAAMSVAVLMLTVSQPAAGGVEFAPPVSYAVSQPATSVALGDLDGDGDLDAAVEMSGRGVVIFLNQGDGTFERAPSLDAPSPAGLAIANLDGDGHADLAVAGVDG